MSKVTVFGYLTNIQIWLHTIFAGEKVGIDALGNTYFRGRPRRGSTRERRWVLYKNAPEASLVPPEWHGWLHHQTNVVPSGENRHKKSWQKPHRPNMTGTAQAYTPPGLRGRRPKASADYNSWRPGH